MKRKERGGWGLEDYNCEVLKEELVWIDFFNPVEYEPTHGKVFPL